MTKEEDEDERETRFTALHDDHLKKDTKQIN